MPLAVKINVALREQNCQKIGSERVKYIRTLLPPNVYRQGKTEMIRIGRIAYKYSKICIWSTKFNNVFFQYLQYLVEASRDM